MYLFFDRQGTLLEIVNDVAMRQYNTNVNKIYVHIQDDTAPESGRIPNHIVGLKHWYRPYGKTEKDSIYGNPAVRPGILISEDIWDRNEDGEISDSEKPAANSFVRETIPYNRNRDLKHFVYGRTYEFFVLNIPSGGFTATPCTSEGCMCAELSQEGDVFNFSGLVQGTIQAVHYDRSCLTLERFSFTIEDSVLLPEKAVTGSQFSWLLTELISMSGKVNGLDDYNNILANKPVINADLSSVELVADTYYKHTGEDGMYKTGVIYYYNGTKLIAIDGGTSLTLNGKETDNAAIYAPISGGDNTGVKVLVPHGDGKEPTWEELKWTKDGNTHILSLGGKEVGTFEIPKDVYVSEITFDKITRKLNFKRTDNKSIEVDLSSLVDFYVAGDGLQKTINSNGQNEFLIKIADNSYLYTNPDGSLDVNASGVAGLAKIKLNGSSQTANTTTFYAPTSSRAANTASSCWVLVPNGSNSAPVWKELTVDKNNLTYALKLGGVTFGTIKLTQEVYLDSVVFDEENNDIVFTYNTASGKSEIRVELDKLMNTYEAGNGLIRDNGVFSIKIAPDSEKYLKATTEGLVFDESALPKQGATGNGGAFIAKTEDEMTALLKPENVGALISYMGEGGGAAVGTPIAVGDTIDTLYFNTSVTPDLTKFTLGEGWAVLLQASSTNTPLSIDVGDMSVMTEGAINAMVIIDNESGIFLYSSTSFTIPAEDDKSEDVVVAQGWNTDLIANSGVYQWTEDSDGTVTTVNQQDLWSSYISKAPFASGGGGAYEKDTLYMVVEEEKEPESATGTPFEVGQTYETIYFNTNVTPDLEALTLSGEGYAQLITSGTHGDYGLFCYDMEIISGGTVSAKCIMTFLNGYDDGPKVIYSTASIDWEGVVASEGWNLDQIAWGDSVAATDQQDKWLPYISSAPFATASSEEENAPKIIAKQIGGESGGNTEEIEKSVSELSNKIDKIVAPTTTREVNTDNSCYVLTPNGANEPTWERIAVTTSNNLDYSVTVGGKNAGTINLTQEIYLDTVAYDSATNKLRFTYNTASGKSTIEVDLSALAGGNVALPHSTNVQVYNTQFSQYGAYYRANIWSTSTLNNVTISPQTTNDAEICDRWGVFFANNLDGNVYLYSKINPASTFDTSANFWISYVPSDEGSLGGTVVLQTGNFAPKITTETIATTDWTQDDNGDYRSPNYWVDYYKETLFVPYMSTIDTMLACGASGMYNDNSSSGSGASGFYIKCKTAPTESITMSVITRAGLPMSGGVAILVLPAPSSGSDGVTDVQVNGTSVVADGIANIPAADITTEGVLTTSSQSISGVKRFYDGISFYYNTSTTSQTARMSVGSDNKLYIYRNNTSGGVCIGSNQTKASAVSNVEINSSDGISFKNPSGTDENYKSINLYRGNTLISKVELSYDIPGVVVALPKTWSTGTSGSVTLPSAGLYEIKYVDTENSITYQQIINWDGTNGTISGVMYNGDMSAEYGFVVQPSGVIMMLDYKISAPLTNTISYRKIGIA